MTETKQAVAGLKRTRREESDGEGDDDDAAPRTAAGKRRKFDNEKKDEPAIAEAQYETPARARTTKRNVDEAVGALTFFLQDLGLHTKRRRTETAGGGDDPPPEAEYDTARDEPTYTIDLPRNVVITQMKQGGANRLDMSLPERKTRLASAQKLFSVPGAEAAGRLPRSQVKEVILDQRYMSDLARTETLAGVFDQFRNVERAKLFATQAQPRPRLQSLFGLHNLRAVHLYMRGQKTSELATGLLLDIARASSLRLLRILDVAQWCTLSESQLDMLLEIFAEWPADNRPTVLSITVKFSPGLWAKLFRCLPHLRVLRVVLIDADEFDLDAFGQESKAVAATLANLQIRTKTEDEGKEATLDASHLAHLTRLHTLLISREMDNASVHRRLLPALYALEHLEIRLAGPTDDAMMSGPHSSLLKGLTLVSRHEATVSEAKLVAWIRRHPRMSRPPRGFMDRRVTTTAVVAAMVKAWKNLEELILQFSFNVDMKSVLELVRMQQPGALRELILNAPDSAVLSDDLLKHILGDASDEARALEVLDLTGVVSEWSGDLRPLARRCGRLRRLSLTVPHVFASTKTFNVTPMLSELLHHCPALENCVLIGPFVTGPADEWKALLVRHERRARPVRIVLQQTLPERTTAETKSTPASMDLTADTESTTDEKTATTAVPTADTAERVSVTVGMSGGTDPNSEYTRALRSAFWIGSL